MYLFSFDVELRDPINHCCGNLLNMITRVGKPALSCIKEGYLRENILSRLDLNNFKYGYLAG